MNCGKLKLVVVGAIAIGGVAASFVIQQRAENRIRENEETYLQQEAQLTAFAAEQERTAVEVAQTRISPTDTQKLELQKLRIERERLRKQISDLETKQEAAHQARLALIASERPTPEYRKQRDVLVAGKIKDASILSKAISLYLENHQGDDPFPLNLNQLARYLQEEHQTLTGTNEFEIVYTGTCAFTNIPAQNVAALRERQAWLAPSGKWARVYIMAGPGWRIVESDDNFQAWEAEHVIPPSAKQ